MVSAVQVLLGLGGTDLVLMCTGGLLSTVLSVEVRTADLVPRVLRVNVVVLLLLQYDPRSMPALQGASSVRVVVLVQAIIIEQVS